MAVAKTQVDPAVMALPAHFINRFQIATLAAGTLVRVAFAEATTPTSVNYRAAVMMTAAEAKELAASILNLLGTTPPKQ
jgi:hypothetical protein